MQHVDRISLNALRVFVAVAVAECNSMKLAATRLGVTAGAVSHQVRGLEDALGVRLLHRRSEDGDDRRDLSQGDQPAVEKGGPGDHRGRLIGRTKGDMNTKLHAVTDADGRPIRFFMTAGQVSDFTGAAVLLSSLPKAEWLLADRGYDADWFRDALKDKGIKPCIPGRKSRSKSIKHDKRRYKRRNRIEIMFGRIKDWRRVATRYDRCPKVFLSAVALAATVMFWL